MFPAKLVFSMWNQRKKSPYLIRTLVFLPFFFLPPQNFQSVNIVFHFFPPGLSDIVIKGGSVFSFLYCRVLKYSSSITQLLSKSNHGRMRARQRGERKLKSMIYHENKAAQFLHVCFLSSSLCSLTQHLCSSYSSQFLVIYVTFLICFSWIKGS